MIQHVAQHDSEIQIIRSTNELLLVLRLTVMAPYLCQDWSSELQTISCRPRDREWSSPVSRGFYAHQLLLIHGQARSLNSQAMQSLEIYVDQGLISSNNE